MCLQSITVWLSYLWDREPLPVPISSGAAGPAGLLLAPLLPAYVLRPAGRPGKAGGRGRGHHGFVMEERCSAAAAVNPSHCADVSNDGTRWRGGRAVGWSSKAATGYPGPDQVVPYVQKGPIRWTEIHLTTMQCMCGWDCMMD